MASKSGQIYRIAQLVPRQVCHTWKSQLQTWRKVLPSRGRLQNLKNPITPKKTPYETSPMKQEAPKWRVVKLCARAWAGGVCVFKHRRGMTEGSGENVITTGWKVNTSICLPVHAQVEVRFFSRSGIAPRDNAAENSILHIQASQHSSNPKISTQTGDNNNLAHSPASSVLHSLPVATALRPEDTIAWSVPRIWCTTYGGSDTPR